MSTLTIQRRRHCHPAWRATSSAPKLKSIHGTEIVRQPDGSLSNWKDPETLVAWHVELPKAAPYRLRVIVKPPGSDSEAWLEALMAKQAVRADLTAQSAHQELGVIRAIQPGPHLLSLRAGGTPGQDGFAVVEGVELAVEQ